MTARVLVVDDIRPNVKILEAKLSSEYFDVFTAMSGPEALASVEKNQPDIVLLDVMMPGMDGFEVCRRIKADPTTSHIPVIMVTALSDPQDRVQGLDAGADDFLTKPVDDVALFARVRSLVRLKLMMDELRLRERTSNTFGIIEPMAPMNSASITSGRILLVEDDAREAERLKKALADGIAVTVVGDGAEALNRARIDDYDVVVISLALKAVDALRLCSQIRSVEETRQVPVLLLVGPEDQKRLVKGLEIGVTDYVLRPIDRQEFLARTRAGIRRKRYQDGLRSNYNLSLAMAVTDSLTGLYNRRYMTTHLETLLGRKNEQRVAATMMLDIDYFKNVNDTYGHAVGDEVLKEIASRVVRNTRGVDLVCRYGGEEFVVVMPDTERTVAANVAERLRNGVAGTPVMVAGVGALNITCSIGVTLSQADDTAAAMLKRADDAMYMAKRDGRNRVVVSD